ncbi:hypothetical protein WG904_02795 [Pedobacter sp. Du54]|uniref:hypothetical protein n=1 Tax=Pedobacter anseongensis TaxID=3133439 RepID=UPI0030AB7094
MEKYTRLFLFAMLSCSFSFCSSVKDREASIKQGIFGRVLWLQGNFMPSPDRSQQKGGTPAVRTLYIYQLTKFSETTGESPLFSKVNTSLVARVKTNNDGYFQCKLLPGKYSIFTLEEGGKFFASLSDGAGNVAPFEVNIGEVTRYDIRVNYKAAF